MLREKNRPKSFPKICVNTHFKKTNLMKKLLYTVGLLFTMVGFTFAQTTDRKVAIGLNAGLSDYHGELNQKWFNTDGAFRGHAGINIHGSLNRFWAIGFDATMGGLGRHVSPDDIGKYNRGFRTDMVQATLNARFKFNNGSWLKENSPFQPYVFFGTGLANYFEDDDKLVVDGTDWVGTLGLGFNLMFSESFGINYTGRYFYTSRDYRDGVSAGTYNDQYMIHTAGLVFLIGKPKDTDMDGVPDSKDKCSDTPSGVQVDAFGCPLDKDGDGVPDYLDKCPDQAGLSNFGGCPDRDNDGIPDAQDKCPDIAGVASAQGCPDRDGDGIEDSKDKCPDLKGTAQHNGCPDTDGDGVIDPEDKCPNIKGLPQFQGCPDTDGDGIPDHLDKCPTIKGVKENNGCPEIKEEVKKVFEKALKGIQFETGKAVIKKTSNGILDNIVTIMKMNPDYMLNIFGHTDNVGDDAMNMELSDKRAEAVKNYLVSKGVDAKRLESKGFGETEPKSTNDTAAGRAENRRVEFTVVFER